MLQKLGDCTLCPRNCGVNRLQGETGICNTGRYAEVSSYGPHFGEEQPLVGHSGSGTIFFTHCNLLCCFCQNYEISHRGEGKQVKPEELAGIMLYLQNRGCHNINLVTPSHVIPQICEALDLAHQQGLDLPVVYNSSGYDKPESLALMEGYIDIYMPDIKSLDPELSRAAFNAPDYPEIVRSALKEMYRQAGDLEIEKGIARRGLLVRHLVMPGKLTDTRSIIDFIAREISTHTYLNLMDQYRPCFQADKIPALSRPISHSEFSDCLRYAVESGFSRLDKPYRGY